MSFGAQSFDDTELRKLSRRHRARHVAEAVVGAREAGIASINVDLPYDVPDADVATWMTTLDAIALKPDHLSLYALSLDDPVAEGLTGPDGDHLPTTQGARRWRDAVQAGQDEDRAAGQYHHAASCWMRPATVATRSRTGRDRAIESRHNLAYCRPRPHERARRWRGPGLTGAWRCHAAGGRRALDRGQSASIHRLRRRLAHAFDPETPAWGRRLSTIFRAATVEGLDPRSFASIPA